MQNTPKLKETVSVANNACWAIGELAIKVCYLVFSFLFLDSTWNDLLDFTCLVSILLGLGQFIFTESMYRG